jgi:hypothetical protein
MASTTAICDSFKQELMVGTPHDFTITTGGAYYWALYTSAATHGTATTAYSTTAELADATGGYDRPGETLANVTPTIDSNEAITDWADPTWTTASFTAASTLLHLNSSEAVAVWNFTGDQTASGGDFVLQLPTYAATTAILRLA